MKLSDFSSLQSSNIDSVFYDPAKRQLAVMFRNAKGKAYVYRGVSQTTYTRLVNAGSPGAYFSKHIKEAYAYTIRRVN
jgi:hypothetical protein